MAALLPCDVRGRRALRGILPLPKPAARRQRVAKAIGPDAIFLAFASEAARRNGDVDWPYRQDDNLYYLTGVTEPRTTLVLLPGEIPSAEELTETSGIATIAAADRFESFVSAVLQGRAWAPAGRPQRFADPVAPSFSRTSAAATRRSGS